MLKSVCRVLFVTYRGTFGVALRILDWDLFMMTVLDLLTSGILHGDYMAFVCCVWLSEETVTFALYNINRLVFITEVESIYSAVRTDSLYKAAYV